MTGDLFDGVEGASSPTPETPPPEPSAGIGTKEIVRDYVDSLTLDEIHAFVLGFAPIYVGLLLLALPVPAVLPNVMLTIGLGIGLLATIGAGLLPGGRVVNRALGYVRVNPHYAIGGQAAGAMAGSLCMALLKVGALLMGAVA